MELTEKQDGFARFVAMGVRGSGAYRAAGYACRGMSDHAVSVEASRLAANPRVQEAVERYRSEGVGGSGSDSDVVVSRIEAVNSKCFQVVMDGEGVDADALQGFEWTAKQLLDVSEAGGGRGKRAKAAQMAAEAIGGPQDWC